MSNQRPQLWQVTAKRQIDLTGPIVMGVLNVTPDSFSDGGSYADDTAAVDRALTMVEQGAAIIDVGGESTRPGATRIDAAEQIRRTVSIIETLRAKSDVAISIDTTRHEVAEAALDGGATIINDVSAGQEDNHLFDLAATRGCGLVLMHRLAPPQRDSYSDRYTNSPRYDDVVAEVREYLCQRADAAIDAGVNGDSIAIDPGFGFGKTVSQNYELINHLDELVATGYPVLVGASRKSFIGKTTGVEVPAGRLAGSLAVAVACWQRGAAVFRAHDVAEHSQALAVAATIGGERKVESGICKATAKSRKAR